MMDKVKENVKSTVRKLSQPGVKRTLLLANLGGVLYYWITATVLTCLITFVILPTLYEDTSALRLQRMLFGYLVINMMLNYILSVYKNSFYEANRTNAHANAESSAKGWAYCTPCQQYMPPRCHHCPICEKCALKRESHCFFTGHCVGYRNQRYFLVFLFYAALAALYAVFSIGSYFAHHHGSLLSANIVNYIYPVATAKWMTGSMQGFLYLSLTLLYMCMTITIGCTGLFCIHFRRALKGQTSHEASTDVIRYSHTALQNLQDVFGHFWMLCFVLPIPSKQPGDGITWNQCKEVKGY